MQGISAIPTREKKFSNGKEGTAEISLKKLKKQQMECSPAAPAAIWNAI